MKKYEAHPAAEAFPMMGGKAFDEFVEDIKSNGLIESIKLFGNQIIDGRNRQSACIVAGIEPRYETLKLDNPISYVVSTNLRRRHLTTKQRSAIAAELANMVQGGDRAKGSNEPFASGGSNEPPKTSTKQAADMMGVSESSVKRSKKTMKEDPEAHEAAKRGEKPVKEKTAKKKTAAKKPRKTNKISWQDVACQEGVLKASSGGQRQVVKDKILDVDPGIEFPAGGQSPEMSERTRAACKIIKFNDDPDGEAERAEDAAKKASEEISATSTQKLERAIRAHKRVLDLEYEARIQERVAEDLQSMLDMYNAENKKHKAVIAAYKGVFTKTQYKSVLGSLHPDRIPNIDDITKARLEKAFSLVESKKLELCGSNANDSNGSTLPKTVNDLMKMKRNKRNEK